MGISVASHTVFGEGPPGSASTPLPVEEATLAPCLAAGAAVSEGAFVPAAVHRIQVRDGRHSQQGQELCQVSAQRHQAVGASRERQQPCLGRAETGADGTASDALPALRADCAPWQHARLRRYFADRVGENLGRYAAAPPGTLTGRGEK